MFITFEGPEGGGKSTQLRLLAAALREHGYEVVVTREPGGTPIGDAIRQLLLATNESQPVGARTEALLFAAARAQLVDDVIRPALARGAIVLSDRFGDSTLAYQVGGRRLPEPAIRQLLEFATGGLTPDLTFLLDLGVEAGRRRKAREVADRLEREEAEFHERVRAAYLELAAREPQRFVLVDATRPVEEIARTIRQRVDAAIWRAS